MPHFATPNHRFLLTLLVFTMACTCVSAQIKISRQVLGTAVYSSKPNGSRALKMTATAGEVLVGTQRGDIKATIGFQQPDDDIRTAVVTVGNQEYNIEAYPNPTTSTLNVSLGEAAKAFQTIELLDVWGRALIHRRADNVFSATLHLPEVADLPSGSYFLRGVDRQGQPHILGSIVVATH